MIKIVKEQKLKGISKVPKLKEVKVPKVPSMLSVKPPRIGPRTKPSGGGKKGY